MKIIGGLLLIAGVICGIIALVSIYGAINIQIRFRDNDTIAGHEAMNFGFYFLLVFCASVIPCSVFCYFGIKMVKNK